VQQEITVSHQLETREMLEILETGGTEETWATLDSWETREQLGRQVHQVSLSLVV
jgi:hypothetical protein